MPAATAQRRITKLVSLTPVHRAFHWLHLHQPQLRQWQLELVRIPAPPFGEADRAAWFLDRFRQLGLTNLQIDDEGNALAELESSEATTTPEIKPRRAPCILISAHLDTVFAAGTPCDPIEDPDDARIYAPGICDNASGLTALLAIAAALRYAKIQPPIPILFAANVGEEGEGDLRGMRHLFTRGPYHGRIVAALALEGSGTNTVVTRGLGSRRLRVTVTGPGGHSWTDAGTSNPILILSRALAELAQLRLPSTPRTTLNVGHISGGTSVNSIPESATALLDLRSTDPDQLIATEQDVRRLLDTTLAVCAREATRQRPIRVPAKLEIEVIGSRPAGALPDDSPLLHTLRAIDRHLTLHTEPRIGSTDANIPLALGIPALALGSGGIGGGIHTLQEWYDPTGRETALRRILLTLLDTAQRIADTVPAP
ncbi:M20/M25/M40 family metallo-hydrolase [Granulicella sp. dw_53]|uniref:M20/M25/M40 family metallo-hydrolase n=1 Tax=Granulicella sp. dw_53 TaxID=2719792 RepID=UPI001BD20FBD|nr:M20/M25/M40 family metallo-hydrolase [Granulicella sp. dw_53]